MNEAVTRRVALLGAESTGKSTLAEALARRPGCAWVPEYLREFVETTGRVPQESDQIVIARTQLLREQEAQTRLLESVKSGPFRPSAQARHAGTQAWLFCDTTPLMTALYSEIYFGRVDPALLALATRAGYDNTLVTAPDTPWVADGLQRESEAVRRQVHERLLETLERLQIPYTLVGGSLEHRLLLAWRALDAHPPQSARSSQLPLLP